MQPIRTEDLGAALKFFEGQQAYLHFEFARGGFVRNLTAQVEEAHLRGNGAYRVALRCKSDGWLVMEGLTHADLTQSSCVCLYALDNDQRLSRALQLSLEPFAP